MSDPLGYFVCSQCGFIACGCTNRQVVTRGHFEIGKAAMARTEAEGRMCVLCGMTFPASHNRHEPGPGCPTPECCTIDMTKDEAWQHWRTKWHEEHEARRQMEKGLEDIAAQLQTGGMTDVWFLAGQIKGLIEARATAYAEGQRDAVNRVITKLAAEGDICLEADCDCWRWLRALRDTPAPPRQLGEQNCPGCRDGECPVHLGTPSHLGDHAPREEPR